MNTQPAPPPRLLIPRPEPAAARFARSVEAAYPGQWTILCAPLMEIACRKVSIPEDAGAVVFSSANGVTSARHSGARFAGPVFCVGPRTTEAARAAGFDARQLGGSLDELAKALGDENIAGPIVHLRGAHTTAALSGLLPPEVAVIDVVAYDQPALPFPEEIRRALASGDIAAIALFSPRTARLLHSETEGKGLSRDTRLVCISPAVAKAARWHKGPVEVAERPDADSVTARIGPAPAGVSRG